LFAASREENIVTAGQTWLRGFTLLRIVVGEGMESGRKDKKVG
jgi:hypothetical protein